MDRAHLGHDTACLPLGTPWGGRKGAARGQSAVRYKNAKMQQALPENIHECKLSFRERKSKIT